jgi:hypothetical protein
LRLAPSWDGKVPPVPEFSIELRSGAVRWIYVILAIACIIFFPIVALMRALAFENRRWQESMYTTSSSGDD